MSETKLMSKYDTSATLQEHINMDDERSQVLNIFSKKTGRHQKWHGHQSNVKSGNHLILHGQGTEPLCHQSAVCLRLRKSDRSSKPPSRNHHLSSAAERNLPKCILRSLYQLRTCSIPPPSYTNPGGAYLIGKS
eukprot:109449-Amphidinium_carterae.2